jgi:hypothetical protein
MPPAEAKTADSRFPALPAAIPESRDGELQLLGLVPGQSVMEARRAAGGG